MLLASHRQALEENETLKDALKREFKQKTNLDVEVGDIIDGRIEKTLSASKHAPAEKPNNLLHAQSVLSKFNSYNFGSGLDYNFTTATKHQKRAQLSGQLLNSLSEQKNTIPSLLDSRN